MVKSIAGLTVQLDHISIHPPKLISSSKDMKGAMRRTC
jgi:hypothetical protein